MIIAAVALAFVVLWPRRLNRLLPAPLVALTIGTLLGALWLKDTPIIGQVPTGFPEVQLGLSAASFLGKLVEPALILALLGSMNSLLTSLMADSMTGTRHNPNRELIGQGIGNIFAGIFEALPGSGAPIGTAINIRAGAQTSVSSALCAILLLALVLGLGRIVETIPLAAIAAILMKIGWDMIDWRFLTRIHLIRREHLFVMLMTLGLTLFVDLITAVAVGMIAAGMAHALQLERLELDSVVSVPLLDSTFFSKQENSTAVDPFAARVGLVALRGSFTVASSNKLVSVISADIKDHKVVIFDFSETTYLDDSAAIVIRQLMDFAKKEQTEFIVMGLSDSVAYTLNALNILKLLPDGQIVTNLDEARQTVNNLIQFDLPPN